MTTSNKLNYTINPNFNPQNIRLTPPHSLLNFNRPLETKVSNVFNTTTQTRARLHTLNNYKHASIEAYQASEAVSRKINCAKNFILDVENPSIDNDILIQSFRQTSGESKFKQFCEAVSQALSGTQDARLGEEILNKDFRCTLRIRDYDGRSLLEQVVSFDHSQLQAYRELAELNHLGELLEQHQNKLASVSQLSLAQDSPLLLEIAKLQEDAKRIFDSLSEPTKGIICRRIYELDGGGEKDLHHGLNIARGNVQTILKFKNGSPLNDAIEASTASIHTASPQFKTPYIYEDSINSTDSQLATREVLKLYELQDLKKFMADSFKDNEYLLHKFRNLNPELKSLINTTISLTCYEHQKNGFNEFSEKFISQHGMRALLNIKNQQGDDLITQLISHQQAKIKIQRLKNEIESFTLKSSNKNSSQILELFNALSDKAKNDLRERVWRKDGGENNPEINGWKQFFGEWGYYGTCKINQHPFCLFLDTPSLICQYLTELTEKGSNADSDMFNKLTADKTLPASPVEASTASLEQEGADLIQHLPAHLKIACVTAELSGVASVGGLASAVEGMVRGLGTKSTRVIMPLYVGPENGEGPISKKILESMKVVSKYELDINGKKHRVMKATINNIRCYFIESSDLFWIPQKPDKTVGNLYEGEHLHVSRRWAVFQSAAAELVYKFSKKQRNPVQLVHVHDSQTALIPKFLATRHPEEWKRGETPATMFTFHNNLVPNEYNYDRTIDILKENGLATQGLNSFMEGLRDADVTTTVSETYAKETQTSTFGNGMDPFVKKTAFEGRLFGIVNGNSNGWDPRTNEQLRTWKSVQGTTIGTTPDLTFGPDTPDLADKIKASQLELCAYLKSLPYQDAAYADLDPEKPIVTYIGRYDSSQKGIDKLPQIMDEVIRNGGQFVCIGLEPDDRAKEIIAQMKKCAEQYGKRGILIVEDSKKDGKLVYQGVFGSLLRAATSLTICPSIFEPCGLVQGESNRFGKKVIATKTGGFIDTLKTEGPEANSYLFRRCSNWYSREQDNEMIATLRIALRDAKAMQSALYHGDANAQRPFIDSMRVIMRNALRSTWETTPDGSLSAVRRLELAMAKAFVVQKRRGQISTNLKTVKV